MKPDFYQPVIIPQIDPFNNLVTENRKDRDDLRGASWWMGQAKLYAAQLKEKNERPEATQTSEGCGETRM
jgi:hypothetical protein